MIWVAPSAVIAGDVTIGEESSVWHHAVLRGDLDRIVLGRGCNVQDGAVLHVDEDKPALLGDRVGVGHRAIVHGATVEDECTIGMGAIVTSGCRVGSQTLVAAGAVLPEGMVVPPKSLVLGVPAKARPAKPEHLQRIARNWSGYVQLARAELPAWPAMQGDPEHRVKGVRLLAPPDEKPR